MHGRTALRWLTRFTQILLVGLLARGLPAAANPPAIGTDQARYSAARADLAAGRMAPYRVARRQLADYPLVPYLDYFELRRNLSRATATEIETFRTAHPQTPFTGRLERAWLLELARRKAWSEYAGHYRTYNQPADPPSTDTELRCYHLQALLHTGQRTRAFAQVPELWQVPQSQPRACDPVFQAWIAIDGPSDDVAWERLNGSVTSGQLSLARYLLRFLDGNEARWGQTYIDVHRNPKLIRNYSRFDINNARIRDILADGIPRLVRTDPKDAQAAWAHYQSSHAFPPVQTLRIEQELTTALARRGQPVIDANLTPTNDARFDRLTDSLLQNAVQRGDWAALTRWYDDLPVEAQAQPKWVYWQARAATKARTSQLESADAGLRELAKLRHYYGFLAAQALGAKPQLNRQTTPVDPSARARLRARESVVRIEELLAVGDRLNARREWRFLEPDLDPEELAAGAYLAADRGWIQQSIFAANAAQLHDNLELRFPMPHRTVFTTESRATALPMSFLYGIARQESAFGADAESSAGAIGMMQLMPSTASMTARRMGLRSPGKPRLKQADLNVKLGSRYLAGLMDRYQGNRALAAAAYNAGPRRVDRWVIDVPAQPLDVWIESVPFAETRSYVKNVLAYSYIYAEKLGRPGTFLEATER